eukprot:TRINITY_DN15254_c0_g1_i2.p2 TRINITY_DN15254_c0_g1~~TRINITY_DN15254_c0_g1_i2.p2  ORF type:complete len:147 (-),score=55.99 TRINITY_DN15254_c0_g1_i2:108-548(-)
MRDKLKEREKSMDGSIQEIRDKNVAAVILAETRGLDSSTKLRLLKLAGAIYTEWQHELSEIEPLERSLEVTQNDVTRAVVLSSLEFDEKGKQFLRQFYEEAKAEGVNSYYKRFVVELCNFYKSLMEATSSKDHDAYTKILHEKSEE